MTIRKIICDYFEQRRIMKSIKEGIWKEVRINPSVTLDEAVTNLWRDLDYKLIGASEEEATSIIGNFRRALEKLGVYDKSCNISASVYLNSEQKYKNDK